MFSPSHPGDFIRAEIIEPLNISITRAAEILGVSRPALSSLLNSRAALTGEMATRVEKAFGVPMDILMRMQNAYDIAQARMKANKIRVRRYRPKSARSLRRAGTATRRARQSAR